jgi:hypothetical protein
MPKYSNEEMLGWWKGLGVIVIAAVVVLVMYVVAQLAGCSNVVDPTDLTTTPTYETDPPYTEVAPTPTSVLVQVPLFQPRRYIDYQAEVVCYYTPSFDISCVPGNQTKIFTYDLTR